MKDIIQNNYMTKNGKIKFKSIPFSMHQEIISITGGNISAHVNHLKVRCWMIVNDIDVPICKECRQPYIPKNVKGNSLTGEFCSVACSNKDPEAREKAKQTMIKNYGVDNPSKSSELREKAKQTNLEKYGVEHHLQSEKIIEKRKATCLEKYGVESYSQTDEFTEKFKQTNLEKYGVEYFSQLDEFADIIKKTSNEKFGTDHYSQTTEFKDRYKETMQSKYGVDNPMESLEVREKAKQTNLEKYGVAYPKQSSFIQEKFDQTMIKRYGVKHAKQRHIPIDVINTLSDKDEFEKISSNHTINEVSKILGVRRTVIMNYMRKHGILIANNTRSCLENDMHQYLKNLNMTPMINTKTVISPYELDFYLPDYNLAIEMNGDYWHSTQVRANKKYHFNKWLACKNQGIRLIQISETEWNYQQEKIKSMIKAHLNLKEKGSPGRKCSIRQIDAPQARLFLEKYHLQGFVGGTHFGAFDETDQLVGAMTFGWTRGNKNSRRFELKRWVTDDKSHAGLFSKTFRFAQKEMQFNQVVSFSMNDWFTGDVYEKAGFAKGRQMPIGYRYFYDGQLVHCSRFTKGDIKEKLPEFYDEALTEKQMMENVGAPQVWNSGMTEWVWRNLCQD